MAANAVQCNALFFLKPIVLFRITRILETIHQKCSATAASDKVDTGEANEMVDAIAKTVAELTSQQDGVNHQQVTEQTSAVWHCALH